MELFSYNELLANYDIRRLQQNEKIKNVTKLFKLLLLALAAAFIFSTSSAFSRKDVETLTAASILLYL